MVDADSTIGELLEMMESMNAASQRITATEEDDTPLWSVILVRGEPETQEMLNAADLVEESWHDEDLDPVSVINKLVARAYSESVGCPPDLARQAYKLTGKHRVLTKVRYPAEGEVWLSPSDAREHDPKDWVEEINGDEFDID